MKLSLFNISNFKVDGGAMFGVVPKVLWNRAYPADHDNLIPLALKSLVVEHDGRVVLIDTGIGDKQDEKFMRHVYAFGGEGLIEGLARRGYQPTDITDVVLTHLHFDHCGGGIYRKQNGEYALTFPNARYHISAAQWEAAINPNVREADSFLSENILPIRDLGALNLIDSEMELVAGMRLRIFNGHTRGLIVPIITHNGQKLAFTTDLIPFKANVPLAWVASYDVEPLLSMTEKSALLEEALAGDYTLIYQHDHYVDCSKLQMTPKGIRPTEGFSFE